jgi:outer membrane protein assembly factor BamB
VKPPNSDRRLPNASISPHLLVFPQGIGGLCCFNRAAMHGNRIIRLGLASLVLCCLLCSMVGFSLAGNAAADDWPTYMHDQARTSASAESTISASSASKLFKAWAFKTGAGVAASPTVVGGVVYVGSWDGYEYALNAATGALKWKTNLGVTDYGSSSNCAYPTSAGVTSSATVQNGVVYVGGGDSYWYALNASNGAVLWRVYTGDNSATGGHYNWSSPLLYNGSAYIGISSLNDCPLVQGQLLRVNLKTHKVVATWNAVPNGQVGGGVWTSPALDAATNTIYVTTGTHTDPSQRYSQAFVALDATTLAMKGSWQVPAAQAVDDGDWGGTPNLLPGGLVAAANKNGLMYAFQRSNISAGPVWQQPVANPGSCPTCGEGTASSGAVGGGDFFGAGGTMTIGNTASRGSVSAFNPATGAVLWRHGLQQGPVVPALAYVNGLVVAGAGSEIVVLDANSGQQLFDYSTAGPIYSPPSVSGGRIYVGSQDGNIYALSVSSSTPPSNTVRVNVGGGTYTDVAGNTWSGDCCNSGGNVFSTSSQIAGTSDPALYQSERWNAGPFTYTFSGLAAGSYQVTLKFAEIAGLGPGQRQFNVAINGTQVLSNLDVAAQVGDNAALDKTFTTTASNGQVTIAFTQGAADNPIVSAIQVVPAS